jgi:hypothetical protein
MPPFEQIQRSHLASLSPTLKLEEFAPEPAYSGEAHQVVDS